jgi:hypothetical protein
LDYFDWPVRARTARGKYLGNRVDEAALILGIIFEHCAPEGESNPVFRLKQKPKRSKTYGSEVELRKRERNGFVQTESGLCRQWQRSIDQRLPKTTTIFPADEAEASARFFLWDGHQIGT